MALVPRSASVIQRVKSEAVSQSASASGSSMTVTAGGTDASWKRAVSPVMRSPFQPPDHPAKIFSRGSRGSRHPNESDDETSSNSTLSIDHGEQQNSELTENVK